MFGLDFIKEKSGRNKIVIKSIEKAEQVKERSQHNLAAIVKRMGDECLEVMVL